MTNKYGNIAIIYYSHNVKIAIIKINSISTFLEKLVQTMFFIMNIQICVLKVCVDHLQLSL